LQDVIVPVADFDFVKKITYSWRQYLPKTDTSADISAADLGGRF